MALPLVDPVRVEGLALTEAQEAIRAAYAKAEILKAGRERIIVTLQRARTYRITVFRQEVGGITGGPEGVVGVALTALTKRGNGFLLQLPAYENDLLHALAATGGLPGLDAYNAITIFPYRKRPARHRGGLE